MKDIIFLPTIQHTGTWFAIDILQKFGYSPIEYRNSSSFDIRQINKGFIVHAHFPLSKNVLRKEKYKFIKADEIKTIYKVLTEELSCLLVIPIRDVLAALITRYGRHPRQNHTYIIDGFLDLANKIDKLKPFYFPVDLDRTKQENFDFLVSLEQRIDNVMGYKQTISSEWSPKNTIGLYPLKEAYLERNIRFIKETIPRDWAYLIENVVQLQPFFEKLGYKDLLWFEGSNDSNQ
ncbi:MAG: hypothetical protein V3U75_12965 [Methylococcaceae bacterium]